MRVVSQSSNLRLSPVSLRGELLCKVAELSGESFKLCYQCGKCSAGCPVAFAMDLLPNQVMRCVRLSLSEELAASATPWLCAACMTCSVRCPKGIDIAAVMEALRQLTLRENEDRVWVDGLGDEAARQPVIAMVSALRKMTG